MKIITMWHDGDFLGTAKDYPSAITFLIGNCYICGNDEIAFEPDSNEYVRLNELFGEDWADIMTNDWNINKFNSFYDHWFELQENYVYDYSYI